MFKTCETIVHKHHSRTILQLFCISWKVHQSTQRLSENKFLQNFTFTWKVSKVSQFRLVAYLGALFLLGKKANWSRRSLCLAFTEAYRTTNFNANAPQRSAFPFYTTCRCFRSLPHNPWRGFTLIYLRSWTLCSPLRKNILLVSFFPKQYPTKRSTLFVGRSSKVKGGNGISLNTRQQSVLGNYWAIFGLSIIPSKKTSPVKNVTVDLFFSNTKKISEAKTVAQTSAQFEHFQIKFISLKLFGI